MLKLKLFLFPYIPPPQWILYMRDYNMISKAKDIYLDQ